MDRANDRRTIRIFEPSRTQRFFLQNILNARIELELETGCHGDDDQDANVYLAGLFDAIMQGKSFTEAKEYLSPYDTDIVEYLNEHPGTRTEYVVYKENADFGLMSTGMFHGPVHDGSYHRRVIGDADDPGRIAVYYRMAGSALEHLRGSHTALVHTFDALSEHVQDFIQIVRKVSVEYFEFMDRISDGSLYHLEKELEMLGKMESYGKHLDEFLGAYKAFRENPTEEGEQHLAELADELRKINPLFKFDIG